MRTLKNSKFQKVNLTDRKVIYKADINIEVDWNGKVPEIVRDTLSINLEGYPSDALVRIDAIHRSESHSFDLGTVGKPHYPEDLSLPDTGFNRTRFFVRVVDRETPGRLYGRSRAFNVSPETHKANKKKASTKILLNIVSATLPPGVPYEIQYPPIEGSSNPVMIAVNHEECPELYTALQETEPLAMAWIMPGCLSSICERLILDAQRDKFDLKDPPSQNSSWQTNLSYVLNTWTTKNLSEIDLNDHADTEEWSREVLSTWSTKSGNPALVISRSMEGLQ